MSNNKRPMVRRRENDRDWEGAKQREPWDGSSSSQWGEDINTRLGALEIKVDQLVDSLIEPLRIFQRSKKFGLALITLALFFGWNGVLQIWDWTKHLFAAAK